MLQRKYGFTLEVDIHGMRVWQAKEELEALLDRCGGDVHEIVVIHGYHGGQALQNMVRNELQSSKRRQKVLSLNNGQTSLLLHWEKAGKPRR